MDPRPTLSAGLRRTLFGLAAICVAGTLARVGSAADPVRSVDATCAWGRLADGKGKLLRCLTRDEAMRLRDAAPAPPVTSVAPVAPAASMAVPARAWPLGSSSLPGAAVVPAPDVPASAPAVAPAPAVAAPPSAEPGTAPAESGLSVEVGPVVPDEGALPDALKNLKKPKDRYVECIDRNGGLTSDRGEVELRFLVQGKGRAEGVSVKKRRGLGEAAAKCVADVVDRRYVGYPEAPAVGASVVVAITKKKR